MPSKGLAPITYYLTRTQIRQVADLGGVEWLREAIKRDTEERFGATGSVENIRAMSARNKRIAASAAPDWQIALDERLSVSRVRQIKKEHQNVSEPT